MGEEILASRNGDVVCWNELVKAMNAVCHIYTMKNEPESKAVSMGCGTLVQRTIHGTSIIGILTDSRIIHDKEMANETFATFTSVYTDEKKNIQLHPDIFFQSSEEFSFTLVGANEDDIESLRTQFSIHPLDLQRIIQPDVYNVKTVAIAQYPDGKSKWLSLARIYEIQEKHILYDASTVACCSGSPVFYACNEHCYLIALHKSVCGKTSVNKGMFINHIFDHLYGDPVQLLQTEAKPVFYPQEIVRIAQKIASKWEPIALATGKFTVEETGNIQHNHPHEDNIMKATRMLTDYQKRRGTRDSLAATLEEFKELNLAERVRTKFFETNSDHHL